MNPKTLRQKTHKARLKILRMEDDKRNKNLTEHRSRDTRSPVTAKTLEAERGVHAAVRGTLSGPEVAYHL